MTDTVDELRQYAMMVANQVRANNKHDEGLGVRAYERAVTFDGMICPECWVKEELVLELEKIPHPVRGEQLKCKHCGFGSLFRLSDGD